MAQRLGRATAGRRVAERDRALSADLLVLEKAAFELIRETFGERVAAARTVIVSGWTGKALPASSVTKLGGLMVATLDDAYSTVSGLARTAAETALDAVGDELGWCEQTLAASYKGLATESVAVASTRLGEFDAWVDSKWDTNASQIDTRFRQHVRAQWLISRDVGEDGARLADRVLSPTRVKGMSGNGVWWRGCSAAEQFARAVSIGVANAAAEAAMLAFNEGGEKRG